MIESQNSLTTIKVIEKDRRDQMGGHEIRMLVEKKLYKIDVSFSIHNCLSIISENKILEDEFNTMFLKEEEKEVL